MAKNKARPARPAIGAVQPKQGSLLWVQGLLCGALVTLATPTALLLGVLLWPGLVALVLDREPGRPRARSIMLCSMAAAVDPLRTLWTSGHSMPTATGLLSSPKLLATAWGAAAAGWLLAEAAPVVMRAVLETLSVARAVRLRAEKARLVEAWGPEPPQDDQ